MIMLLNIARVYKISGEDKKMKKKVFGWECLIFILCFCGFFGILISRMGAVNMLNTLLNTAYALLTDTVLYIMAIAVIMGGIAGLLTEFGVVALVNRLLSPLMKPLYGLPGASIIGILTTYLSDNPAILTLAGDNNFRRYFKKYQIPALTNVGTAFGMGMIVTTYIIGIQNSTGESFVFAALLGNIGAVVGSIISTRLMLIKTKKIYGDEKENTPGAENLLTLNERITHEGNIGERFINALLEGGKSGVNMGVAIIPGVLIICTVVMMFTNGCSADGTFTGAAYEGIALIPNMASKIQGLLTFLFGFSSPECVSVPLTALGAAGAAIGLIPTLVSKGLASGNDIAVFTAMCMCWSGYLSTHVAMMDGLKCRELTGHAILCHTIGGLCAGISAHILYVMIA